MKITVGQLKKVIHSQLAEAKTAKQGETKRLVSESDYLRNKSPRRYDSNSKFSTFNNEPGDELMSGQTGSTPKYSGYILIKYENGLDTMIVKSPDDGNMERWVAGPSGHSGYTIFANNRQYEFTDTVKESIIGKKSISTEAKTAKQGEVKKINEAVKMNIEQPYSNLYIKGWGMDANGNKTIIVGFPNDRGFPIQTNGTLPNTHHIISKAHKELSSDELAAVGKEITAYVSAHGSANQKSRLRTRSGTNESRSSGEVKNVNEAIFTKLIKKLIVEETEAIKGAKLNESITEANTGSESIADKLFRQCMIYPDIIDPIQRIEIFGIIAKKLQDHALLLSKKYARDAKI